MSCPSMLRAGPCLALLVSCAFIVSGCSDSDSQHGESSSSGAATTTGQSYSSGILGCRSGDTCQFVFVAQTLDDRVEVFSPGDPEGRIYRGTLELDLKPNDPHNGDHGDGRLDEPFGMALQAGFFHVIMGHYPSRSAGSLLSVPRSWFAEHEVGSFVATPELYQQGRFTQPAVHQPLDALEPIFVLPHESGRLLVSVFANDLFGAEDAWTQASELLVIDAAEPGQAPGRASLADLDGGLCAGASQAVTIAAGELAIACDGNEAVAFLDIAALGTSTPVQEAAAITGRVCPLPVMPGLRVRHLAPDGDGGVVIALGPGIDITAQSYLYRYANDCTLIGLTPLPEPGRIAAIVAIADDTWLFTRAAAALPTGARGLYVARDVGAAALEVCGPVDGLEQGWTSPNGTLDPLALARDVDGSHVAVGAAPSQVADQGDPGYGKVLWVEMPADPCREPVSYTDLTQESSAPETDLNTVATWRRAPLSLQVVEVRG